MLSIREYSLWIFFFVLKNQIHIRKNQIYLSFKLLYNNYVKIYKDKRFWLCKKRKSAGKSQQFATKVVNIAFGFNNISNLSFEENELVLNHLFSSGIDHITWTGGEAVLYPQINKLMREAKEKGIHNKLVTNAIYLSKNDNEFTKDILNTLDEINLSIDSIDNNINVALGKENNHFEIIKNLLEKIQNQNINIKIRINTVVSKQNIDKLEELGEFLNNYQIEKWKFLKFMPVREKALENEALFEVSETDVKDRISKLKTFENIGEIEYKSQSEFEKSIVILPNADIIQTQNGKDHYFGNILTQETFDFDKILFPNKIRTFIAHSNENVRSAIINSIKNLTYVDVIGTASTGLETYNKIIDLKPEIVFAEYNFENMSGLDLVTKVKEKLQDKFPVFNTIGEIPDNELMKVINITGNKLNADVTDPYSSVATILEEYKQYKY